MIPGVGIAPTYTISRTVLSDAVALVRGDRFYTVSPPNKTETPSFPFSSLPPREKSMIKGYYIAIALSPAEY
jgi:hypothetical protein